MMIEQIPNPEAAESFPEHQAGGRWTRHRIPWDGGRAILYFILSGMMSILFGVILFVPLGFNGSVIVTEVIVFGAMPLLLSAVFATGLRQWFTWPKIRGGFWVSSVVAVTAFVVTQSNLLVFLDRVYPIPSTQLEFFRRYLMAESPLGLIGMISVAAVVPALFEEFAFRGLIQSGLRASYGAKNAILWTGLLFAVLHMNPWNFIGLWSLGCMLGYLTERTGSILPAMFLHLVNNVLALVLLYAQGAEQWEKRPEFIPWYWTVLAGLVLITAIRRLHILTERPASPGPLCAGSEGSGHEDVPSSTPTLPL